MKTFKTECVEETTDSQIKFQEKGKTIVFLNSRRRCFLKVKVDGCQILDGSKCDNLLIDRESGNEYFVELKGTDVAHALEQLERSIDLLSDKDNISKDVSTFIVSTNVAPKISSKIQVFNKRCKKKYGKSFSLVIKEKRLEINV